MSIQLPLLIREKLDYYLYFQVWQNRVKTVNLEYVKSLNIFTITHAEDINLYGFRIKLCNNSYMRFHFRIFPTWKYINNCRFGIVGQLPKHYYHTILKEIL